MYNTVIVGFAGKARSGKDTAAKFLAEQTDGKVLPMAATLKKMMLPFLEVFAPEDFDRKYRQVFDQLSGALKEEPIPQLGKSPRELLQTLGTEWGRNTVREDLWLVVQHRLLVQASRDHPVLTIPDIRFDNEAGLCDMVYLVVRDDVPEVAAHSSEGGLSPELITGTISNNGTFEELQKKVSVIAAEAQRRLEIGDGD